jgi:outer membrane protein assembly factor BamB
MKKSKVSLFFIILTCVLILFIKCGQQKNEYAIKTETEDGVNVLMNPNYPRDGVIALKLEEELSIGEEERENYIFDSPSEIRVGKEGKIYVSDWGFTNVRCFDKNGQYLRTIGRKGQGPGEFESIRFNLSNDGKIYFMDPINARISILDAKGNFINNFKALNLSTMLFAIYSDENNNIYFSREFRSEKDRYKMTIHRYNTSGDELLNYGEFLGDQIILYERDGKIRQSRRSVSPITVWIATRDGRLYAGYSGKYKISVYEPNGSLSFKFGREYEAIQDTENWLSGTSDFLPAFYRNWLLDDNENLWIELLKRKGQKEMIYDVFSPEGIYIKQFHIKHRIYCIKNKKAYCVVKLDEGMPLITRNRMIVKAK